MRKRLSRARHHFASQFRLTADGDQIVGTGGLRKLRFGDSRRGKGKRGVLRVIYYFWTGGPEFWLFTLYDKDEMDDLTPKQREVLKERVKGELKMRRTTHDEKA